MAGTNTTVRGRLKG